MFKTREMRETGKRMQRGSRWTDMRMDEGNSQSKWNEVEYKSPKYVWSENVEPKKRSDSIKEMLRWSCANQEAIEMEEWPRAIDKKATNPEWMRRNEKALQEQKIENGRER